LRARLGLESAEVVADRRLCVVELPRRRGDRSEPCERIDDPQPGDIQHASIRATGDIHRVRNIGATTAISLHVYGTDITRIGSSARRYYD
jgi:predicted metal-dependent enzyme (double-stranded beta helix superfamily)